MPCPYIVKFYDSFPDSTTDGQCLVMEYMRWGSLQEHLSDGKMFDVHELAVVAHCMLKALECIAAHDYVHRDIKVGVCAFCCDAYLQL